MQLSRASTIPEWREACDLLPWRELATAYNQLFQIECSPPEWKAVLVPAKERTLGDVCELLACHARIPRVREVNIFGAECLHAGAFLTIRALLQEAELTAEKSLLRHRSPAMLDAISRFSWAPFRGWHPARCHQSKPSLSATIWRLQACSLLW